MLYDIYALFVFMINICVNSIASSPSLLHVCLLHQDKTSFPVFRITLPSRCTFIGKNVYRYSNSDENTDSNKVPFSNSLLQDILFPPLVTVLNSHGSCSWEIFVPTHPIPATFVDLTAWKKSEKTGRPQNLQQASKKFIAI